MFGSEVAHAGWAVLNVTDKENSICQDTCSCFCVHRHVCVEEKWGKTRKGERVRDQEETGRQRERERDRESAVKGWMCELVYSGLHSQRQYPPIRLTTEACPWTNNTTLTVSHKEFSVWFLQLRLSPSGAIPKPVSHYHSSGWSSDLDERILWSIGI